MENFQTMIPKESPITIGSQEPLNRVTLMAQRYTLYLKEKAVVGNDGLCSRLLRKVYQSLETCWNKIVPVKIRGVSSEYQAFEQSLALYYSTKRINQTDKSPLELNINQFALDKNLMEDKFVLGIAYSRSNMKKTIDFLESQLALNLSKHYQLCPVCLQGQMYKLQIQPKTLAKTEHLILFWKGMFDELIVLKTIPILIPIQGQQLLYQNQTLFEINGCIGERKQYESQIKTTAEIEEHSVSTQFFTQKKIASGINEQSTTHE